jgi:hypothetical protein
MPKHQLGRVHSETMRMSGAAGAVAAVERDWHDVIRYFETQGAVDPANAISLPSDHQLSTRMISQLLRDGDLQEAGADGGTYWLDVEGAVKRRKRSNRRVGRLLLIISATAAAAVAIVAVALR